MAKHFFCYAKNSKKIYLPRAWPASCPRLLHPCLDLCCSRARSPPPPRRRPRPSHVWVEPFHALAPRYRHAPGEPEEEQQGVVSAEGAPGRCHLFRAETNKVVRKCRYNPLKYKQLGTYSVQLHSKQTKKEIKNILYFLK